MTEREAAQGELGDEAPAKPVCKQCGKEFDIAGGAFCSDACMRAHLPEDLRPVWDRMPEDARGRVHKVADGWAMRPDQAVALWAHAQRNEQGKQPGDDAATSEARERKQDELDESLADRAGRGEYGPECLQVVSECTRQHQQGASRRVFLRAVRQGIERVRHGTGPSKPRRPEPEQPALPLASTGTDGPAGKDARLP